MNNGSNKVVVAQMKPRERREWNGKKMPAKRRIDKRLMRKGAILTAAFFCLTAGALVTVRHQGNISAVMQHVSAGFEYDDTLGRLQFVSNILPQSAMVFLQGGDETKATVYVPTSAQVSHTWSQAEPWLEYACTGDIACCQDGEVMTIVKNRADEYTVRVLHDDGYESIYSGLTSLSVEENNLVAGGQTLGTAQGVAAFELRKDGLSILPVFAAVQGE